MSVARRRLEAGSGAEPSLDELAQTVSVPVARVKELVAAARQTVSLDATVGEDTALGELLEDGSIESPIEPVLAGDLARQVERALATLAPRDREVVRWRFGIGGGEPLTLEKIGARLRLTRERIRQIELRALGKLARAAVGLRGFTER
jgi:RNA polymerase primary sigma factor